MATLLDKKDDSQDSGGGTDDAIVITAPAVGAAAADVAADGTLIQHNIGDPPANAPTPTKILVRQIGLVDGEFGPFGFVAPDQPWDYSQGTFNDIIASLLAGEYERRLPNAEIYIRPLDIHCAGPTRYVFYLPSPGPFRKWRFARTGRAITLGDVPEVQRANYWSLRHVATDGQDTPAHHSTKDCRIVYFTATKTLASFNNSYNIHLELLYIGGDASNPNLLPIVIDPDVRYPGGSGES